LPKKFARDATASPASPAPTPLSKGFEMCVGRVNMHNGNVTEFQTLKKALYRLLQ